MPAVPVWVWLPGDNTPTHAGGSVNQKFSWYLDRKFAYSEWLDTTLK